MLIYTWNFNPDNSQLSWDLIDTEKENSSGIVSTPGVDVSSMTSKDKLVWLINELDIVETTKNLELELPTEMWILNFEEYKGTIKIGLE